MKKGCLVAAAVGVFLCLIAAGVGGFLFYRLSQNPDFQKVTKAVGGGIQLMQKAQNAPGTAELKEAGCQQAIVLEAKDLKEFIEGVDPKALKKGGQQEFDFHLVQCTVGFSGEALSCEEIATVYAGAVKDAPEQFMVQSSKAGGSKPACQGIYSRDGKLVRELKEGESPAIPGQ